MKRTGVSPGRQGETDRDLGGEVGRLNIRAQPQEGGLLREGWEEESDRGEGAVLRGGTVAGEKSYLQDESQGNRQSKRASIFEKRGIRLGEPVQSDQKDPKGGAKIHKD